MHVSALKVHRPAAWRVSELPIARPVAQRLSLAELLARLDSAGGVPSLNLLESWLHNLDVSPAELRPHVNFGQETYRRNRVASGTNYDVLVLCWRPGQRSPIHDHSRSACAVAVLSGVATEVRFERSASGRLAAESYRRLPCGSVTASFDDDMHLLANRTQPAEDLITLHVYCPPLSNMRIYPDEEVETSSLSPWTR